LQTQLTSLCNILGACVAISYLFVSIIPVLNAPDRDTTYMMVYINRIKWCDVRLPSGG